MRFCNLIFFPQRLQLFFFSVHEKSTREEPWIKTTPKKNQGTEWTTSEAHQKKKGVANADLEIPLSLENGPFPCDDQKKRRGKGEKGE
jgi:hypothetical protein